MDTIKMLDLQKEFPLLGDEVRAAIDRVLEHQWFVGGPEVGQLEQRMAGLCGQRFAVAVSSGTDALLCIMMSLGIGPGDEVVTTPFTFFSTAGSIVRLGARPVFVDIQPDTFNIDPDRTEAAITERTKAILPVHLFGQCAELNAILEIAARQGHLPVIEDAAQAIGATYHQHLAGSMGFAAAFSFYPTKNLGALGEGGMIVTGDQDFAQRCRFMRNHGQTSGYHHDFVGGNFRLDTIKAATLLAKLDFLERFQTRRRHNAARYDELLADAPLQTPAVRPYNRSVYHQYSILCDRRDDLAAHLKERGIASGIYYPLPLHLQPCFANLGYKQGDFPVAEASAGRILALPVHPQLTDTDLERVSGAVSDFFAG